MNLGTLGPLHRQAFTRLKSCFHIHTPPSMQGDKWAKISSVMDTSAPYFGQHNPNLKTYDSEQCQKV